MRVVAGKLGGRTFEAPRGHRTHPMSDKVRGALFNVLGDITGLTLLDPYAGSGAISIEAISRGAESAIAIDVDKGATTTIANNVRQLAIHGRIKVIRANAASWSQHNSELQFDLMIADPPYDAINVNALTHMAGHVSPGGLAVFSLPPHATLELPEEGFLLEAKKSYGDATIHFYRMR